MCPYAGSGLEPTHGYRVADRENGGWAAAEHEFSFVSDHSYLSFHKNHTEIYTSTVLSHVDKLCERLGR